MTNDQDVTEVARHSVYLSSELADDSYTISGIAIGEGDITRGQSGVKKKWTKEALSSAAESLAGRPLVVDHQNTSRSTVGKVTNVKYKDGIGVLYEADLFDEELAEKISNDLLEVSIRGKHNDVSEMDESEEGAKIVEDLVFDNLSIVPRGAAPSNSVEIGPSAEVSAAECAEMMDLKRSEGSEESVDDPEENTEEQEERAEAELAGSVHEPTYDGRTSKSWDRPSLEDFTDESWDSLSDDKKRSIGGHFIFSKSGWTADSFGDLKLPVVETSGELNENAVQNAKSRDSQVDGLSSDQQDRVESILSDLSNDDSEENSDEEITENSDTIMSNEEDEEENTEIDDGTVEISEDELSELRQAEEELSELREESESRSEQIQSLREEVGEDLEELKARTEILDEVDTARVEELRETDDPVVMSESKYTSLEDQVDAVRTIYAKRIAEESALLDTDEVEEKFDVEEMSEKLEEMLGEDYEEELSPAPRSRDEESEDPEESEELEETTEEDEEVAEKQEELAGRLFN